MMKKISAIAVFFAGSMLNTVHAEEKPDDGSPKGKAIITLFTNAHSGFGRDNDDRGFELDRAYLGYQYDLPKGVQLKAVVDFGQSDHIDDYHRIGYIKNAQVAWCHGGLTLSGGLISTTQFKLQEDFWGRRYVMKSFQDEYDFGSSADLAVSAAYKFNDYVSADVILANGEGYKKLQVKDGLQYGAGVTFYPFSGLVMRFYGSYNEDAERIGRGITNLAAFVGYRHRLFSVGAEGNYQFNTEFVTDHDLGGVSVYVNVPVRNYVALFGRWDCLASKGDWNDPNDGMTGVVGADFRLGKYVRLSPNFRLRNQSGGNSYYAYLNLSCSF